MKIKPLKNTVIKGEFHFRTSPHDLACIEGWLGEPDNPESYFLFTLHQDYFDTFVDGLKLVQQRIQK